MSSSINCVYIPRMSNNVDEAMVSKEFLTKDIGRVKRVDFVPIDKKRGFEEYFHPLYKSGFVHLDESFNSGINGEIEQHFSRGEGYKIPAYCSNEYWILCKAHSPIQETMMNNHQIVENSRFLEEMLFRQASILEKQAEILEKQSTHIERLEKNLEGVRNVVYQLVGGLYNQRTQNGQIQSHLEHLFKNDESEEEYVTKGGNTSNIWPTTRQGDKHEQRLNSLEESVQNMLTFGNCDTIFGTNFSPIRLRRDEEDDNCSISTHSSMPELINESLNFDSDSESREKRIRISAELCGNN
jgi:hypothetical protein